LCCQTPAAVKDGDFSFAIHECLGDQRATDAGADHHDIIVTARRFLSRGECNFRGCFPIGLGLSQLSLLRCFLLRQIDVPSRGIFDF
jgi:hypothetical protein